MHAALPYCLSLVIASAPLADSDPASFSNAGWLLLGLAGLAAAANQLMSLVEKFRSMRAPDPGEVSADRVKAIEDRLGTIELRLERQMGSIESELSSLKNTLTHIIADFNYAIGKLDGRNSD